MLLVLHPQVASLHLVGLDHVAEGLVSLLLRRLQLGYLLQELHSLLVEEAPRLLLGFQGERGANLRQRRAVIAAGLVLGNYLRGILRKSHR